MYVPTEAVSVFSSNTVDYMLDIDNLLEDSQFVNKVKLPNDYFKDKSHMYLKGHVVEETVKSFV